MEISVRQIVAIANRLTEKKVNLDAMVKIDFKEVTVPAGERPKPPELNCLVYDRMPNAFPSAEPNIDIHAGPNMRWLDREVTTV